MNRSNSPPLVSVIIPTFERHDAVTEAIDSVLSQSYDSVECVVVDDASIDGTAEFLEARYAGRIVLVRNLVNRDKSFSRNEGVRISTGSYVCFLDSDDVLTQDSIEGRMRVFNESSGFEGIVFGLVDRPGRAHDQHAARLSMRGTHLVLSDYLEDPAWLHISGILANRRSMLEYGQWHEGLTIREDVELFIRLLCRFEFRSCGSVVARMRVVDRLRARKDYVRIMAQGRAFSEALAADPLVSSQLGPFLGRIQSREEATLLRAVYHSGRGSEFRRQYRRAVKAGMVKRTWRWRRRYLASFLFGEGRMRAIRR